MRTLFTQWKTLKHYVVKHSFCSWFIIMYYCYQDYAIFNSIKSNENIVLGLFRSNHHSCSMKGALKNFAKFTWRHSRWSLFFKAAGLRPSTLLKEILQHGCFPVNFAKFLRTHFLNRTPVNELLPSRKIWVCYCYK